MHIRKRPKARMMIMRTIATTAKKQWLFSRLKHLNWRSYPVSFNNLTLLEWTDFVVRHATISLIFNNDAWYLHANHSICWTIHIQILVIEGEHRRYFQRITENDAHKSLRYVNANPTVNHDKKWSTNCPEQNMFRGPDHIWEATKLCPSLFQQLDWPNIIDIFIILSHNSVTI